MLLVVARVVEGCFPPDLINQTKRPIIKETASSALGALRDHLHAEFTERVRVEEEKRLKLQRAKVFDPNPTYSSPANSKSNSNPNHIFNFDLNPEP